MSISQKFVLKNITNIAIVKIEMAIYCYVLKNIPVLSSNGN